MSYSIDLSIEQWVELWHGCNIDFDLEFYREDISKELYEKIKHERH